jgi:hypothetical protein
VAAVRSEIGRVMAEADLLRGQEAVPEGRK